MIVILGIALSLCLVHWCGAFGPKSAMCMQSGHAAVNMSAKRRMTVRIKGESVYENVLHVELKKELSFFRGCGGILSMQMEFSEKSGGEAVPAPAGVAVNTVYVTAEDKEVQLNRFLNWLEVLGTVLGTPLESRKISFQGPPTVVFFARTDVVWGDVKGFTMAPDIPGNGPKDAPVETHGSTMEAKGMHGTDECV